MRLVDRYRAVRARTVALASPLSAEDQMVQSMPEASPTKWHLAHTTWFFEAFVLARHVADHHPTDASYGFLFNSYYEGLGPRLERGRRGQLSRPSLAEVHAYRRRVDDAVEGWLESGRRDGQSGGPAGAGATIIELGLHHEQQHQELLLTDVKHALGLQPLRPAYQPGVPRAATVWGTSGTSTTPAAAGPARFRGFGEGVVSVGHDGDGFAFDNERPRHQTFLQPFELAERPVTCREYLGFMEDQGYARPELWLSEGWRHVQLEGWRAPLYWERRNGQWVTYTLGGVRDLALDEPVAHVSHFEADAFARWAGARLPTEMEWEHAAGPVIGHFADSDRFHPGPSASGMFGDVWQWTQSAYGAYPGYRPPAGVLGEYNGKFMSSQMVLRGGSCLTPGGHLRATYRNFFPPEARWQMSGIRLARDA